MFFSVSISLDLTQHSGVTDKFKFIWGFPLIFALESLIDSPFDLLENGLFHGFKIVLCNQHLGHTSGLDISAR